MRDVSRPQLVVYAAAAVAIALIGARYLHDGGGSSGPPTATRPASGSRSSGVRVQAANDALVVVHVAGEVRRPGVYRLRGGERVKDAVDLAGGGTGKADLDGLNLAAKVEDGRQIVVPRRGGAASAVPGGGEVAPASGGGASGGGAGPPSAPINLN